MNALHTFLDFSPKLNAGFLLSICLATTFYLTGCTKESPSSNSQDRPEIGAHPEVPQPIPERGQTRSEPEPKRLKVDLNSPKSTIESYLRAVAENDLDAALMCVITKSEIEGAELEASLNYASAFRQFRNVASSLYGAAESERFMDFDDFGRFEKAVSEAGITTDEDGRVVFGKKGSIGYVVLNQLNNSWKIVMAEWIPEDQKEAAFQRQWWIQRAGWLDKLSTEVAAGQYQSAEKAYDQFQRQTAVLIAEWRFLQIARGVRKGDFRPYFDSSREHLLAVAELKQENPQLLWDTVIERYYGSVKDKYPDHFLKIKPLLFPELDYSIMEIRREVRSLPTGPLYSRDRREVIALFVKLTYSEPGHSPLVRPEQSQSPRLLRQCILEMSFDPILGFFIAGMRIGAGDVFWDEHPPLITGIELRQYYNRVELTARVMGGEPPFRVNGSIGGIDLSQQSSQWDGNRQIVTVRMGSNPWNADDWPAQGGIILRDRHEAMVVGKFVLERLPPPGGVAVVRSRCWAASPWLEMAQWEEAFGEDPFARFSGKPDRVDALVLEHFKHHERSRDNARQPDDQPISGIYQGVEINGERVTFTFKNGTLSIGYIGASYPTMLGTYIVGETSDPMILEIAGESFQIIRRGEILETSFGLQLVPSGSRLFPAGWEKERHWTLCISNLRTIGVAARIYATDNRDLLPSDFKSMAQFLIRSLSYALRIERRRLLQHFHPCDRRIFRTPCSLLEYPKRIL